MTTDLAFPEVEVKAVRNATISVDEAQGVVEAFAAAIGNKDSVGDIIVPGAFSKSLQRRKPRVVWGHNWNEPIGKVLEITEVPGSDSRLPAKMKSAGVGGLFVKVQFNLASERGREAFASVLFFGEDQEWSIGYKTIVGDYDPSRSANLLREVELYEVSPVLHGANNLTGTISVKNEQGQMETVSEVDWDTASTGSAEYTIQYTPTTTASTYTDSATTGTVEEKRYFDGHNYPSGDPMPGEEDESDERRMIRKAFASALGNATGLKFVDNDKVVFEKPGEGMWMSKYRRDGRMIRMTRPVRARSQVVFVPVEPMEVEGRKPPVSVTERAPSPMPQRHECSCGNPAHRRFKEDEDEPEEKRDYSPGKREEMAGEGQAMEHGGYPIKNVEDLKNAIQAIGRAKDPAAAKRHIIKRARALGHADMIPDSWTEKSGEPDDIETKVGRVISNRNMGKLRQAAELLNAVVSSGMPPEKPSMEDQAEEKKELTGKVAHIEVNGAVDEAFTDLMQEKVAEYGWYVVTTANTAGDNTTVDVHFKTDEDMSTQVKELAAAIENLDSEVDVSVEKKDL